MRRYFAFGMLFFIAAVASLDTASSQTGGKDFVAWVSDQNCGVQHAKQGGKDCVKKCLRGGAHVGHPEWTAQKVVLIQDKTNAIWQVENPESLRGYEGERISFSGELNSASNSVRVTKIHPYRDPAPSNVFEFHNGFWINLHHFLRGEARRILHPPKDQVKFVVSLSEEEKLRWNEALEYYKTNFAEKDLVFDAEVWPVKDALSHTQEKDEPPTSLDPALRKVLISAAPIYRKHWWPEHKRANQEWIDVAQRILDQFGKGVSERIQIAYGKNWPKGPFRTDVTIEAGWAGAYTTVDPVHITISSTDAELQDYAGLEMLFHEASHGIGDWLSTELKSVVKETGGTIPDKFWHSVIFFTAGEITRSELEHAGMPAYSPYGYLNGIYERGEKREICALERSWKQHIEKKSLDSAQAIRELVRQMQDCASKAEMTN